MPRLGVLLLALNILVIVAGVAANYWLLQPVLNDQERSAAPQSAETDEVEYEFYSVEKIVVSVPGEGREHYFLLDLVLQAERLDKSRSFAQIEPLVRSSVVAYLSGLTYRELRSLPMVELQTRLEAALAADFARMKVAVPFKHVLVSKFLVQ